MVCISMYPLSIFVELQPGTEMEFHLGFHITGQHKTAEVIEVSTWGVKMHQCCRYVQCSRTRQIF